jgi:hypothetical protein
VSGPFLGAYALFAGLPGRAGATEYAALRALELVGLEMPLADAVDAA